MTSSCSWSLCSAGGVKLVSGTERITLDNTLDERLRLLEDRMLPEIRADLFGPNPNHRHHAATVHTIINMLANAARNPSSPERDLPGMKFRGCSRFARRSRFRTSHSYHTAPIPPRPGKWQIVDTRYTIRIALRDPRTGPCPSPAPVRSLPPAAAAAAAAESRAEVVRGSGCPTLSARSSAPGWHVRKNSEGCLIEQSRYMPVSGPRRMGHVECLPWARCLLTYVQAEDDVRASRISSLAHGHARGRRVRSRPRSPATDVPCRLGCLPRAPGWEACGGNSGGQRVRYGGRCRRVAEDGRGGVFMWFERRFALQQKEMMREMRRVVAHESDRVITTVLAGPHERIIDRELYEIWRDMRWRGIVKARHLVLAIHDYYMQKLDDQQRAVASGSVSQRPVNEEEVWALRCLDLKNLQRIIEVLDYDASGFVTIQEVNQFTTSRPEGWR
ncbi:hypothetical protein NUW54_g13209 [Trametes sanguinea]|uniref:Uncharacterized protein n=1 Tax=Trametes sanguinea TaxID=158606 RepID=A0ACC1MP66_9APHY|nr:hypothetical protein NUW54_g13209 [Trametes sanguinea]